MPDIAYTLSFQVANGPQVPLTGTLSVDAYDMLEFTVAAAAGGNDGTATVAVQPGPTSKMKLLMISAGNYEGGLTFKTDAAAAVDIGLNGPLVLIGAGAAGLLGTDPDNLTFTNPDSAAVKVKILVGRLAT